MQYQYNVRNQEGKGNMRLEENYIYASMVYILILLTVSDQYSQFKLLYSILKDKCQFLGHKLFI